MQRTFKNGFADIQLSSRRDNTYQNRYIKPRMALLSNIVEKLYIQYDELPRARNVHTIRAVNQSNQFRLVKNRASPKVL